jgi:hypothetical protein
MLPLFFVEGTLKMAPADTVFTPSRLLCKEQPREPPSRNFNPLGPIPTAVSWPILRTLILSDINHAS